MRGFASVAALVAAVATVNAGGGGEDTTTRPLPTTAAAGQTHVVSWGLDVSQASITINVGDTVQYVHDSEHPCAS